MPRELEYGGKIDKMPQETPNKRSKAMGKTVVLYPGVAVSHFVPMMQLADALLEAGYAVTVALIDPSLKGDIALAAVVDRVASAKPSVTFHTLPRIPNPPTVTHDERFMVTYVDLVNRHSQHLHDLLCSLPPGGVHALILDVMAVEAIGVTRKLRIPAYAFFPSNASALATFHQVASIREEGQLGSGELGDTPLSLHGVPPMPASHLGGEMLADPESETYKSVTNMLRGLQEADGILVHTFASLEARAVRALGDGRCFPAMPPVYCVGPLVAEAAGVSVTDGKHECLAWLDEQPDRSVVFLCFGSTGAGNHSEEQIREIAAGLENSGHRFLWVVRALLPTVTSRSTLVPIRTSTRCYRQGSSCRGMVAKLWAPQVDVLSHRATSAFVTHCGWKSVLEGIMAVVPMLCWPLYAEQKMNKVFMAEEFGVGVEMVGWQQGMVKAEEVEAKVRLVMESKEGEQLRARVAAHRDAAAVAWVDGGGSSRAAFGRFLADARSLGSGVACGGAV